MHHAPQWASDGTRKITLNTSRYGKRILNFHGSYQFWCGEGTGFITGSSVAISKSGSFAEHGHYQEKSHGKVTGTNYLRLWGQFASNGKSATVDYLSDFVYAGKSVKNPYSTKIKSQGSACESWVRGTATPTS